MIIDIWDVIMPLEDQEFTDFMTEASIKAMELCQKYDKLSDNNKRKFLQYIEPMVRAGGTKRL
jgi:GTP-binding protein EngB required for normal cell division